MRWGRSLEFQHLQLAVPLVYKKQMGAEQCSLIISDVTSFDSGGTMHYYDVTYFLRAGLYMFEAYLLDRGTVGAMESGISISSKSGSGSRVLMTKK